MKSLVAFLLKLLQDCGSRCAVPTARDELTLRERVEHEGESFITITLPAFAKALERGLETGSVTPSDFPGFGHPGRSSCLPSFLGGFMRMVFDSDGQVLNGASVDCIAAVRQFCLFAKKVERPCTSVRNTRAIEAYRSCDDDVISRLPEAPGNTFRQVAHFIVGSLGLSGEAILQRMLPSHGPGAVAEGFRSNRKWSRLRRWHRRFESSGLTYYRYLHPHREIADSTGWFGSRGGGNRSTTYDTYTGVQTEVRYIAHEAWQEGEQDSSSWPDIVDPENETPVKVTLVPKTLSTPRVIAVEPAAMQFVQQGIGRLLMRVAEYSPFTCGRVNFRKQEVNQGLALQGSLLGNYATLDMSEASDRVSLAHVEALCWGHEDILELLMAARSQSAVLPGGEKFPLKKYASMGSALCFPVEALVFFVSIIALRHRAQGINVTWQSVMDLSRSVYVYGDDLCVPADEAASICDGLEAYGFRVNRAKSFWTGEFRESCGTDAFKGSEVTPVYLRQDAPVNRADSGRIFSWVATINQLIQAGYRRTGAAMKVVVEGILGPLPHVAEDSEALGWWETSNPKPRKQWNADYQRWEHLCYVGRPSKVADPLFGSAALAKCYRVNGSNSGDPRHLEQSARPYSLALRRKWVSFG